MTIRTALALSLFSGLAAVASAGGPNEDTAYPVVQGPSQHISLNGGWDPRTVNVTTVYDTVDADATGTPTYSGLTITGAGNNELFGDWGTLQLPRTGQGSLGTHSQMLEEMTFGLSCTGGIHRNDVRITFYDRPRLWETDGNVGSGGFQASATAVLGSFTVELSANTPVFPNFSAVSVSGLSLLASPIIFTNNYFGITIDPLVHGTTNRDVEMYQIFNTDVAGPIVGWSEDRFGRDVDNNGIIPETECNRILTGNGNPANIYLQLNVNFCDTDFDGSGFSDTDDFDLFVHAFTVGC